MTQLPRCPLCLTDTPAEHYHQDRKREYLQCPRCHLVYVHPSNLPSKDVEKLEYSLHENSADDEGYVRFLSRLLHPLLRKTFRIEMKQAIATWIQQLANESLLSSKNTTPRFMADSLKQVLAASPNVARTQSGTIQNYIGFTTYISVSAETQINIQLAIENDQNEMLRNVQGFL